MSGDRANWAYLSRLASGPNHLLWTIIGSVGVEETARRIRTWKGAGEIGGWPKSRRVDRAARDLEIIESMGGRFVTPDDIDWPAWRMTGCTAQAAANDPLCVAPLGLWVVGAASLRQLTENAVAVVGARDCTDYGRQVTTDIVDSLTPQTTTVVSGGGPGIENHAHRTALDRKVPTMAVLNSVPGQSVSLERWDLYRQIADGNGLLVSECPPDTVETKQVLLQRNRLIAALSDAVMVVEAGRRGGVHHTARWARKLDRPAVAIPGSVLAEMSVTYHQNTRKKNS